MQDIRRIDLVDIELTGGTLHRSWLKHSIGMDDEKANCFGVRVFRNGEPVNLGGGSVQGHFLDPHGNHIAITTGNHVDSAGNVAYVVLPASCYNYEGQFSLAIKLLNTDDDITGTMRIVDGMVDNTYTDNPVAPVDSLPDYEDIIAVYEEMVEAKEGAVRFDIEQDLEADDMLQARANIEAASDADLAAEISARQAVQGMIAEPYTSGTYEGGEYRTHGGNLYRCKAPITTAESWTPGHWEIVDVGEELNAVRADEKAALRDSAVMNIFDYPGIAWHQPVYPSSGVTVTYLGHAKYSFSGTANAVVAEDYYSNLSGMPYGLQAGDTMDIWVTGLKKLMFRVFASSDGENWTGVQDIVRDGEYLVKIPDTAVGLLLRVYIASGATVDTTVEAKIYNFRLPEFAKEAKVYAEAAAWYPGVPTGEATPSATLAGFYPVVSGTLVSADNYVTREYEPLPGSRMRVRTKFSGGSLSDGLIQYVKFFSADRSYYTGYNSVTGTNTVDMLVEVPYWAKTMAVCADAGAGANPLDYYVGTERDIAVFIGDSYVQGNSLTTAGLDKRNRFSTLLCRRFGWLEKNYAHGGMGFITGDTTYGDQIENAAEDTAYDHARVSRVFICGGRNDVADPVAVDELQAAVKDAVDAAHESFPNAMIVLVPMMWSNGVVHQNIYNAYQAICRGAAGRKAVVIQRAYTWLTGQTGMILSDRVHPNVEGHRRIADRITNALAGGKADLYPAAQKMEAASGSLSDGDFCAMVLEDGVMTVNAHMTLTAAVAANTVLFTAGEAGSLNNQFYLSNNDTYVPCVNTGTGETGLLVYTTAFTGSGYTNTMKAKTALSAGTWYVLSHRVPFGREEYAGNA